MFSWLSSYPTHPSGSLQFRDPGRPISGHPGCGYRASPSMHPDQQTQTIKVCSSLSILPENWFLAPAIAFSFFRNYMSDHCCPSILSCWIDICQAWSISCAKISTSICSEFRTSLRCVNGAIARTIPGIFAFRAPIGCLTIDQIEFSTPSHICNSLHSCLSPLQVNPLFWLIKIQMDDNKNTTRNNNVDNDSHLSKHKAKK